MTVNILLFVLRFSRWLVMVCFRRFWIVSWAGLVGWIVGLSSPGIALEIIEPPHNVSVCYGQKAEFNGVTKGRESAIVWYINGTTMATEHKPYLVIHRANDVEVGVTSHALTILETAPLYFNNTRFDLIIMNLNSLQSESAQPGLLITRPSPTSNTKWITSPKPSTRPIYGLTGPVNLDLFLTCSVYGI